MGENIHALAGGCMLLQGMSSQRCNLVVDDAPSVRDHGVVFACKGMVAGAGRCKGAAHHLAVALLVVQQLLAYVIGCKGG